MILYTDNIIHLHYQPAEYILLASLHIVREYDAREARSAFMAIVSHVNDYSITKLLLDFSHNTLDLTAAEYKQNISLLTAGLMNTPLRRIARIGMKDPIQEEKILTIYQGIQETVTPRFRFQSFASRQEAVAWLKS